jgi:hypothetical protein
VIAPGDGGPRRDHEVNRGKSLRQKVAFPLSRRATA